MTLSLDPFDAPFWNSCQVRFWIAYRDKKWVEQFTHEPDNGLAAEIMYGNLPDVKVTEKYQDSLLVALRAGKITATGLGNGKGQPIEISAQLWEYLEFKDVDGPRAQPTGSPTVGSVAWRRLSFPRQQVLELWPPNGQSSPTPKVANEPYSMTLNGDSWGITFNGKTKSLRNTKGIRYIEYLIRNPNREVDILELFIQINPPDISAISKIYLPMNAEELNSAGLSVTGLGDAGETMTPEGKRYLKNFISKISEQIEDAKMLGELEKQQELEQQQEELISSIALATGKGGAFRKDADNYKRMTDSVRKCINTDIKRVTRFSKNR